MIALFNYSCTNNAYNKNQDKNTMCDYICTLITRRLKIKEYEVNSIRTY